MLESIEFGECGDTLSMAWVVMAHGVHVPPLLAQALSLIWSWSTLLRVGLDW